MQDGRDGGGSAEGGLEQWEMVVGASRLYDWHGSRLGGPAAPAPLALRRSASGASAAAAAPDTLRSRARSCPPFVGGSPTRRLVSLCMRGCQAALCHILCVFRKRRKEKPSPCLYSDCGGAGCCPMLALLFFQACVRMPDVRSAVT
jgi:hypothetical protein